MSPARIEACWSFAAAAVSFGMAAFFSTGVTRLVWALCIGTWTYCALLQWERS